MSTSSETVMFPAETIIPSAISLTICSSFVLSSSSVFAYILCRKPLLDYYSLQQYDVAGGENIFTREEKQSEDGSITFGEFSLEYDGVLYNKCYYYNNETWSESSMTNTHYIFFRIPVGYDGCVVGFIDGRNQEALEGLKNNEGDDIPRGAGDVYFRMK